MLVRKIAPLIALALLSGASAAHAQSDWYLSGSAAAYLRQDVSRPIQLSRFGLAPAAVVEKVTFDPGVVVNAGVGRRIGQHLRVEAQVGYTDYTVNHVNPFATDPDYPRLDGRPFNRIQGDRYTRETGAVIGFYDFSPLRWGVAPYLGVGLGASENRKELGVFESLDGVTLTSLPKSEPEGFSLAEVGLSIPLSRSLTLAPNYRFVRYFRGSQDGANVLGATVRYAF